jgi:chemotaxis protein methyltransferase CheR
MVEAYVNIDRFKTLVEERHGLRLTDPVDHLERVIRTRMRATGCRDFGAYDALLTTSGESSGELRAVAALLTVGETHFFRNGDHFRALIEHALPDRMRLAGGRRPVRVLSVGCASGEEPYTVAILLRENFADLGPLQLSLAGVDLSPAAIGRAKQARYSAWSLRETPGAIRERYFRPEGSEFALVDDIRRTVSFEERNLFENDLRFWAPASRDIVFCRNVIIYFSPEKLNEAIARMTSVLMSGGFLFLGHSESLRGMTDDFDLLNTNNTFYYQRRDPSLPKPNGGAGSWTATIERASLRVQQLTSRPPPPSPSGEPPPPLEASFSNGAFPLASTPPEPSAANVDLATELYRQERFVEALELLRSLPEPANREPNVQLLTAAILTNQGDLKEAEGICRGVLSVDDMNAGAHYLTALARERAGDLEGALRHDQMAAYLDATFAMPRLHMGMLARHSGDLPAARRELAHAVILLAREDASRILLFGGGFSREAITQLCRAELEAAGGKS